jgi:hypothetical protein
MFAQAIRSELDRLNLHPVNLGVSSVEGNQVRLGGSLLPYWDVPSTVEAPWFIAFLSKLPDGAGGRATMEAFAAALAAEQDHSAETRA